MTHSFQEADEYETADSGVSEQSSTASDDNDDGDGHSCSRKRTISNAGIDDRGLAGSGAGTLMSYTYVLSVKTDDQFILQKTSSGPRTA